MRVGLSSIYSWRPHVEQLAFLNQLLTEAGCSTSFLVCDAQLPSCYARELKRTSKVKECITCVAGGLRSFVRGPFTDFGERGPEQTTGLADSLALSSAKTIFRTESSEDVERPGFGELHARLARAVDRAYVNALNWINNEQLEGIVVFNGRMDATRAILQAGIDKGIPVITVERPWFSHGLLLVPNDGPLDLKQYHRLNRQYRDVPLTLQQACKAAGQVASRFQRTNDVEWRAYNKDAVDSSWPAGARGLKVLILPSSRNEVDGHPDWATGWKSFGEGLDATLEHLGVDPASVVLRCHPVWGERMGTRTGELSEIYYSDWARERGIQVIGSCDRASSISLMAQADVVIVNGGTAVFEASALGKPTITLSPSFYSDAGFSANVFSADMLDNCQRALAMTSVEIVRQGLRFGYTSNFRHVQFEKYVRATSPTSFKYFHGADGERLVRLFATGLLEADDSHFAADANDETEICMRVLNRDWSGIAELAQDSLPQEQRRVQRHIALRWLDAVRGLAGRGDQ